MRTTLDIDEDILRAAKEIAARERSTAGKVLSNLARRALRPEPGNDLRSGVPLLPPRAGGSVVTAEEVRRLRDDESS
jgi:hypothetical protein